VVGVPLGVVVGATVPHCAVEQDTLQVTPLFAASLATVAVTCAVAPASTVAVANETETLMGGGWPEEAPHPEIKTATTTAIGIAVSGIRFFEVMANLSFGLCEHLCS
jgi:hypothetical protein